MPGVSDILQWCQELIEVYIQWKKRCCVNEGDIPITEEVFMPTTCVEGEWRMTRVYTT